MRISNRIFTTRSGVGCLVFLVPWVVGFVKLADWAIAQAMK